MKALPASFARDVEAELCRRDFGTFVRSAWEVLEPGNKLIWHWHLQAMCDHLQAVSEGSIKRLLINVPPGHGKSMLVAVFWPAWTWLRDPGWRMLCCSYAQDLSVRDSVRCRDLIESNWFQELFVPDWQLKTDQNTKSWFENSVRGLRIALSVGGKGTGFRGETVVFDDPHNVKARPSTTELEDTTFWWEKRMSSRLNDMRTGTMVGVMQRVHQQDLSARVLESGEWEHLCLPNEWDGVSRETSLGSYDPRTRVGQLLFPARFDEEATSAQKRLLGAEHYASQYQQAPIPPGGQMLKTEWIRYYDGLPSLTTEWLQSWDLTFGGDTGSSYVVGQVWCRQGSDIYLVDQVRRRMTFTEILVAIRSLSKKWPQATTKLIERAAAGSPAIDTLKGELTGIIAIKPQGSKESRFQSVTPLFESGNVLFPSPNRHTWVADLERELLSFPASDNDDQVDALSQALNRMQKRSYTPSAVDIQGILQIGQKESILGV